MLNIFKRYKKRTDGKTWTKNTLAQRMYETINADFLEHSPKYDVWWPKKFKDLNIEFESANYTDKNETKLVNSIYFKAGNDISQFHQDLRGIACQIYGIKYDPLRIRKDEMFEGSAIEKECVEIYRPFLKLLSERDALKELVEGNSAYIGKHQVSIREIYKDDYLKKHPL